MNHHVRDYIYIIYWLDLGPYCQLPDLQLLPNIKIKVNKMLSQTRHGIL